MRKVVSSTPLDLATKRERAPSESARGILETLQASELLSLERVGGVIRKK